MQEEKSCLIFIEQTLGQSLCALPEELFNVGGNIELISEKYK